MYCLVLYVVCLLFYFLGIPGCLNILNCTELNWMNLITPRPVSEAEIRHPMDVTHLAAFIGFIVLSHFFFLREEPENTAEKDQSRASFCTTTAQYTSLHLHIAFLSLLRIIKYSNSFVYSATDQEPALNGRPFLWQLVRFMNILAMTNVFFSVQCHKITWIKAVKL